MKMKLPIACAKGECDHAANDLLCVLQPVRCLSGECAHASRGEFCPTEVPARQPAHRESPVRLYVD